MRRKLFVVLAIMGAMSITGIPTAFAVFIWTVAIPFMEQFQ